MGLAWLRQGESTWNLQDRIQGSTNESTLTDLGKEQARRVGDALKEKRFDNCVSSPLTRFAEFFFFFFFW